MAKIWFVRRHGEQWVAPGGSPAFELPLRAIQFPLDVGTHRRLGGDRPTPLPSVPAELPDALQRVLVEIDREDVRDRTLSGYAPGFYDSPVSPGVAAARLSELRG